MNTESKLQTIHTVPERCRMCYTCVRECPAKAIRIIEGQALIVHERCIGCGNCVRVCSQKAKQVVDSIPRVRHLLDGNIPVAAIVAPSFPAEFSEYHYEDLVAKIAALGFKWVNEVAFGADVVANEYKEMMRREEAPCIATTCPAIVLYVEKYFPALVSKLAPIVSPMVATARILRKIHGANIRVVFIGPCTSKKREGVDEDLADEIDAVVTFVELRQMLAEADLTIDSVAKPRDFDKPHAGLGALFPLCGGMLQAADLREDLIADEIVSANGEHFTTAIKEFAGEEMRTKLLELLACDGCIMGAGMSSTEPIFRRRGRISGYIRDCIVKRDREVWKAALDEFKTLDFTRKYSVQDQRLAAPDENIVREILERMGKFVSEDELNCGACGYDTCRQHAEAIHKGLAESEMCLPYTIDRLNRAVDELEDSHKALKDSHRILATTQDALMQSERLASMGQLAAGIAHEVNNPLGVVLMYAHLMLEDLEGDSKFRKDALMIAEQADRCKKIVGGLLHFARQNKVLREPADIPELINRCMKAVVKPQDVELVIVDKMKDKIADVDADQLLQVLTNIVSNAYAAMPAGGVLELITTDDEDGITIAIKDNGTGIAPENRPKIFEPFFTTKQIGKGTGLGLAVTYGIVKMHRGDIHVESNDDPDAGPTGTVFTVKLPRKEEV